MSFQRTYLHTALVALDDFGAAVFFNRDDVTISSLCGLVRRFDVKRSATSANPGVSAQALSQSAANALLRLMGLRDWQISALRVIGAGLELIRSGHCERAIAADIQRSQQAVTLLRIPT